MIDRLILAYFAVLALPVFGGFMAWNNPAMAKALIAGGPLAGAAGFAWLAAAAWSLGRLVLSRGFYRRLTLLGGIPEGGLSPAAEAARLSFLTGVLGFVLAGLLGLVQWNTAASVHRASTPAGERYSDPRLVSWPGLRLPGMQARGYESKELFLDERKIVLTRGGIASDGFAMGMFACAVLQALLFVFYGRRGMGAKRSGVGTLVAIGMMSAGFCTSASAASKGVNVYMGHFGYMLEYPSGYTALPGFSDRRRPWKRCSSSPGGRRRTG